MIVGRHKKTHTLYKAVNQFTSGSTMQVQSAESGRWYRIPKTAYQPLDETWRYLVEEVTIDQPTAGEPVEDGADIDPDLNEYVPAQPTTPAVDDLPMPILPQVHGLVRDKSYSVGTAITLLDEIKPWWPLPSTVQTLRVAALLIQDELGRLQGEAP